MSKETPIISKLCTGNLSSYQLAVEYLNSKKYDKLLAELLHLFNKLLVSLRNVLIPISIKKDTPKLHFIKHEF